MTVGKDNKIKNVFHKYVVQYLSLYNKNIYLIIKSNIYQSQEIKTHIGKAKTKLLKFSMRYEFKYKYSLRYYMFKYYYYTGKNIDSK